MRRKPAVAAQQQQPSVAAGGGKMVSVIRSLPAPVGGWNARDPIALMRPIDALKLENWYARIADCVIRGGCTDHVTGFASRPKTLAVYNGVSGSNKLFALNDAGIFDCTTAGALGASALARTNGYHSWVQTATSGGSFLILVNGVDKPAYFDGASWVAVDGVSTPALTGVTTTGLIAVNVYKRRLFFIEKNKLSFWYLAPDSIGGALTEFQLGPLCTRGGFCMAMGTWSLDGGNGPDDYAAFVTSEGQVVVFTGTDPGTAANWLLVGVYYVGKPLGRRCFVKYGGDLVLLTEYGGFPLLKMVQSQTVDFRLALTNRIEGAFVEAARNYGSNAGWMAEIYPGQSAMIFNVPKTDGGSSAEQYVMNTTTKSWCKFTGWNASDFVMFNKELYFADATKVAKGWTGHADYGGNIVADGQAAFNNFGDARDKEFGLFRPQLQVNGTIAFSIGVAVDFETAPTLSEASYSLVSTAIWDVSMWDAAFWAAGLEVVRHWRTPQARIGQYGSGLLKVATNSLDVHWVANDYNYILGTVVT